MDDPVKTFGPDKLQPAYCKAIVQSYLDAAPPDERELLREKIRRLHTGSDLVGFLAHEGKSVWREYLKELHRNESAIREDDARWIASRVEEAFGAAKSVAPERSEVPDRTLRLRFQTAVAFLGAGCAVIGAIFLLTPTIANHAREVATSEATESLRRQFDNVQELVDGARFRNAALEVQSVNDALSTLSGKLNDIEADVDTFNANVDLIAKTVTRLSTATSSVEAAHAEISESLKTFTELTLGTAEAPAAEATPKGKAPSALQTLRTTLAKVSDLAKRGVVVDDLKTALQAWALCGAIVHLRQAAGSWTTTGTDLTKDMSDAIESIVAASKSIDPKAFGDTHAKTSALAAQWAGHEKAVGKNIGDLTESIDDVVDLWDNGRLSELTSHLETAATHMDTSAIQDAYLVHSEDRSVLDFMKALDSTIQQLETALRKLDTKEFLASVADVEALVASAKAATDEFNAIGDADREKLREAIGQIRGAGDALQSASATLLGSKSVIDSLDSLPSTVAALAYQVASPLMVLIIAIGGMFVTLGTTSLLRWVKTVEQRRAEHKWMATAELYSRLAVAFNARGFDFSVLLNHLQASEPLEGKERVSPPTPIAQTLAELTSLLKNR